MAVMPNRADASELRKTAIVRAVQKSRKAVVNIRGQKTIHAASTVAGHGDAIRRVNGMGTGVIIDARGYIVTNYHVVDGVAKISVTLADGTRHRATLVSHDPKTDLALIQIKADELNLQVIDIGTSNDLMTGETVIAVGNAYGYEHTVTRGIISALHRTVQVSDTQNYYNLIQTDASINPGNSGGPLLNIDGDMIGINVAVRVGAQGIGFAIPVDSVMDIAAELMSIKRLDGTWHGLVASKTTDEGHDGVLVERVEPASPAAAAGILAGDRIQTVDNEQITRALDIERFLLGGQDGHRVQLNVERAGNPLRKSFVLTSLPNKSITARDRTWHQLGLRLKPIPEGQFRKKNRRYRGGLSVAEVRRGSAAYEQGIRRGDILVGMHIWETVSMESIDYVLDHNDLAEFQPIKFFILRGNQTLFGHMKITSTDRLSRK